MSLGTNNYRSFASVIADGTIRVKTEESNPKAVRRDYELSDGTKGTKFELVYNFVSGIISNIQFFDTKFGKNLQITIDDVILSMGVATSFAEDVMKKIPNIDLSKEVKFTPYSFTDDKGKLRKGITVTQENVKLFNFFYNPEAKENTNGFPVIPEGSEKFGSEDWKIHFLTCRQFLVKYLEENILSKFENVASTNNEVQEESQNEGEIKVEESVDGEIKVDEIPFADPTPTTPTTMETPTTQPTTTTPATQPTTIPTTQPTTTPATQPTTIPAPVTTPQQTTAIPATGDNEEASEELSIEAMKIAIANFAKTKLNVVNEADTERVVMESCGLAYISSNIPAILEKMKAL